MVPDIRKALIKIRDIAWKEENPIGDSTEEAADLLIQWQREDRKEDALKIIQEHIWAKGFKSKIFLPPYTMMLRINLISGRKRE